MTAPPAMKCGARERRAGERADRLATCGESRGQRMPGPRRVPLLHAKGPGAWAAWNSAGSSTAGGRRGRAVHRSCPLKATDVSQELFVDFLGRPHVETEVVQVVFSRSWPRSSL